MSDSISVRVSGLSGSITLELPNGATVGDAREVGEINAGLSIRSGGHAVSDDVPLEDGQALVTAPPAAKHGLVA